MMPEESRVVITPDRSVTKPFHEFEDWEYVELHGEIFIKVARWGYRKFDESPTWKAIMVRSDKGRPPEVWDVKPWTSGHPCKVDVKPCESAVTREDEEWRAKVGLEQIKE